jgi:hypothetical protein
MFKNILFFNMASSKINYSTQHVLKVPGLWDYQSVQHPGREKGKVL